MNSQTFPFRTIRTFAASKMVWSYGRLRPVPCEDGSGSPEHTATTYHRTKAAAERTARSSTHGGYVGILKAGRVEENREMNSYGMTEEQWAEHLREEDRLTKEHQQAHDAYNAHLTAEERKHPPTLESLKHIRPDLYW